MRLFITSLFLLSCLSAHTQLYKGGKYFNSFSSNFGGYGYQEYLTNTGEFGGASIELSRNSNLLVLAVSPAYGVFASDHWLLGGAVFTAYFSFSENENLSLVGLSPFARYYINPQSANTHWFGQLKADFVGNYYHDDFEYRLGGDVRLGLTHFLGEGLAIDAFVGLRDQDLRDDSPLLRIYTGTTLSVYLQQGQWPARQAAQAGFRGGSWMIGGTTIDFGWEPGEREGIDFSVSPNIYYFVNDHLAVGAGVGLSFFQRKGEFSGIESLTFTDISLAPQVRYYISETNSRQQWFIAGGARFLLEETRLISDSSFFPPNEESFRSHDIGFGFGLNSFLTPNVAIELGPSLRYFSRFEEYRLGFDVGLQFFLTKKQS